ncbi:MAG: NAD(P)-binding protein [Candidatus Puniceispirillaceae bacterium]
MQSSLEKSVVLVGGGISALMSAYFLKKISPDKSVHIIENSSKLGGKYSSFNYEDDLYFDQGMHVIYESCDEDIDNIYREILPESEWNIFHKNEKDIAGVFYNGKLQQYSHYIDLRNVSKDKYQLYLSSLFGSLNRPEEKGSAEKALRSRFGDLIFRDNHEKILLNLYGQEPRKLTDLAIKLTALERVLMFDEPEMLDLMKSSLIRSRIGFPNQLSLPDIRPNEQKALYPKKYGMYNFVNAFEAKLGELGVFVHKNTEIENITLDSSAISSIDVRVSKTKNINLAIDTLIWCAGLPSIASVLGVSFDGVHYEQGRKIVYVNLIFDKPIDTGRLYYFYCYDQGFSTHRVTNYSEYCPDEKSNNRFRCCVELWPEKNNLNPDDLTEDNILGIAISELKTFGVISEQELKFSSVEKNVGRFPLPSLNNQNALNELRTRLKNINLRNLINVGVLSEEGIFFLPDVLNDAFEKLRGAFK